MGFASGSVSFQRYHVSGPHPKTVDKSVIEKLGEHAFGAAHSASSDGIETGWIAPTHLFDTRIEESKVCVGRFLHVAMRLDRTAAPPNVVRSYQKMEEAAALDASGKQSLNREEVRQAREAAEARAEKESRAGAFRRMAAYPMVFDPEGRAVYFGSLSATAQDKLLLLFAETFGAKLVPMNAPEVAARISEETGCHRAYEDAVPFHLADPPVGEGNGQGPVDAADRSFLGREFLTWLWHEGDTREGAVPIGSDGRHNLPGDVEVVMDKMLKLDCDFQLTGRDVIYADSPADAPEARAALRTGKQPTRAGLTLWVGADEYVFTLDAAKWQVGGLKVPDADEPDPRVRLEERLMHVVRCSAVLDALYAAFLGVRFGREFSTQAGRMRKWAGNGHTARGGRTRADRRGGEKAALRLAR
ncbi:MAG TPA: hypothetical protein VM243_14225 [Phycisphaerae bacterium]|nr:hypothetical protein [Phycisphaerae bacterium]